MPRNSALVGKSQTLPVFTLRSLRPVTSCFVVIVDIFDDRVGEELDLRVLLGPFQHDLGSAKAAAAMNKRDLGGEASEERGFLHGGIAAADHHDFFS